MLIIISGISGSGKTTIGTHLAKILQWEYLDMDSFYYRDKPITKLSTGEFIKNWDCLEALNIEQMNMVIGEKLKIHSLILVGFALTNDILNIKPNLHIHLKIGETKEEIIERCMKARYKTKGEKYAKKIIVEELVYPFYMKNYKLDEITSIINVYNNENKYKSIEEIIENCQMIIKENTNT